MDAAFDQLERHCPRLGGLVNLEYCRRSGDAESPCFKIFDCWWETFDIEKYMKAVLSPEAFARLACQLPPAKISGLVDLIRKAQQNTGTTTRK